MTSTFLVSLHWFTISGGQEDHAHFLVCRTDCKAQGGKLGMFFFFAIKLIISLRSPAVRLGGHGPIQPAYPHHLGDQFPQLPVALPQSQPLDVDAHQPRLPQPQRQAEGGMELKVS